MIIDPTTDQKLADLQARTNKLVDRRERLRAELKELDHQQVDLLEDPDATIVLAGEKTPQHRQLEAMIKELESAIQRSRDEELTRKREITAHNQSEYIIGREALRSAILNATAQLREHVEAEKQFLEDAAKVGVRFKPTLSGIGNGFTWQSPSEFLKHWSATSSNE